MVRINRIYTRSGDQGTTSLVGGKRVKKNSLRVKCYGELDELNSLVGWARTLTEKEGLTETSEQLALIQNEIFDLGAYLATPGEEDIVKLTVDEESIARLEGWIDNCVDSLPELKSFVLPGGSEANSVLHTARAVCRRVERQIMDLADAETVQPEALKYINRLSDYLFAVARKALSDKKLPEHLWTPNKS